jgi:hypothetical protein
MNIRTPESSTNVKINVQCSDKEEMRSVEATWWISKGFLLGLMRIFVVLILVLFNIL